MNNSLLIIFTLFFCNPMLLFSMVPPKKANPMLVSNAIIPLNPLVRYRRSTSQNDKPVLATNDKADIRKPFVPRWKQMQRGATTTTTTPPLQEQPGPSHSFGPEESALSRLRELRVRAQSGESVRLREGLQEQHWARPPIEVGPPPPYAETVEMFEAELLAQLPNYNEHRRRSPSPAGPSNRRSTARSLTPDLFAFYDAPPEYRSRVGTMETLLEEAASMQSPQNVARQRVRVAQQRGARPRATNNGDDGDEGSDGERAAGRIQRQRHSAGSSTGRRMLALPVPPDLNSGGNGGDQLGLNQRAPMATFDTDEDGGNDGDEDEDVLFDRRRDVGGPGSSQGRRRSRSGQQRSSSPQRRSQTGGHSRSSSGSSSSRAERRRNRSRNRSRSPRPPTSPRGRGRGLGK